VGYRVAADAVVVLHAGFIAFVLVGGFAAWRWRRLAWLHVPAAAWGVLVEVCHWPCPLASVEQALRRSAGEVGYAGSFIERYLLPLIYPPAIDAPTQLALGAFLLAVNAVAYGAPALASLRLAHRR
jgi:hypothetical protein